MPAIPQSLREVTYKSPKTGKSHSFNWNKPTDPTPEDYSALQKYVEDLEAKEESQSDVNQRNIDAATTPKRQSSWMDAPLEQFGRNVSNVAKVGTKAYEMGKGFLEMAPITQTAKATQTLRGPGETPEAYAERVRKGTEWFEPEVKKAMSSPYSLAEAGANALDPTGAIPGYMGLGKMAVQDIQNENYPGLGIDVGLGALPLLGAAYFGRGRAPRVNTTGIAAADLPKKPSVRVVPPVEPLRLTEIAGDPTKRRMTVSTPPPPAPPLQIPEIAGDLTGRQRRVPPVAGNLALGPAERPPFISHPTGRTAQAGLVNPAVTEHLQQGTLIDPNYPETLQALTTNPPRPAPTGLTINPSKQTLPPIESLPKVDTSIVGQTVPAGARQVGSGSTIVRNPQMGGRMAGTSNIPPVVPPIIPPQVGALPTPPTVEAPIVTPPAKSKGIVITKIGAGEYSYGPDYTLTKTKDGWRWHKAGDASTGGEWRSSRKEAIADVKDFIGKQKQAPQVETPTSMVPAQAPIVKAVGTNIFGNVDDITKMTRQEAEKRVGEIATKPHFGAEKQNSIDELFNRAVAQAQRGEPEAAMTRIQQVSGGGVLNPLVEKAGDLIHRMSEKNTAKTRGWEFVKEKVDDLTRMLEQPEALLKEHADNVKSNASFRKVDPAQLDASIKAELQKYVTAHENLPAFTETQQLARGIATDIGKLDFAAAKAKLVRLKEMVDMGPESWTGAANTLVRNEAAELAGLDRILNPDTTRMGGPTAVAGHVVESKPVKTKKPAPVTKIEREAAAAKAAQAVQAAADVPEVDRPQNWGGTPKTVTIGKGLKPGSIKPKKLGLEEEMLPSAEPKPLRGRRLQPVEEPVSKPSPGSGQVEAIPNLKKLGAKFVSKRKGQIVSTEHKPAEPVTSFRSGKDFIPDTTQADVVYQDRSFPKTKTLKNPTKEELASWRKKGYRPIDKEGDTVTLSYKGEKTGRVKAKRIAAKAAKKAIRDAKKANAAKTAQEVIDRKMKEQAGGKGGGGTPTVSGLLKDKLRNSIFYKGLYKHIGVRGLTELRNMGEVGSDIAKLLMDEKTEINRYFGKHSLTIREVRRDLNKAQQSEVVKILDGKKTLADASDPKVTEAYRKLRALTEELGDEATKADIRMKDLGGNNVPFEKHKGEYWPHRYDEALYKDPVALRDALLKAGNSPVAVEAMMKRIVEEGERFSSSQHKRSFNLPGYSESLDALEAHALEMSRNIVRAKRLGSMDIANPNSRISKLIAKAENPKAADRIVKEYLNRMENRDLEKSAQDKLYKGTVKAQVLTKLSQFPITNLGDIASQAVNIGVRSTAKGIFKTLTDWHGAVDESTATGAQASLRKEIYSEIDKGNLLGTSWGSKGSEKFIRTIGSIAGKAEAQRLFDLAKRKPKYAKALERFVDGDVREVLKQDKMTPEQLNFAGGRAVELSSGLPDRLTLSKAFFADNQLLRLPLLFKKFAFMNTKSILEAMESQPTMAGKAKKVATALVAYQALGEGVGDLKAAIKGFITGDIQKAIGERGEYINSKNWPLIKNTVGGAAFDRMMANYMQSALFGIMGDVTESVVRRRFGKASGVLGGPVVSDMDEALTAAASAIWPGKETEDRFKAVKKFGVRRIPWIGQGLAERWYDKEDSNKIGEKMGSKLGESFGTKIR